MSKALPRLPVRSRSPRAPTRAIRVRSLGRTQPRSPKECRRAQGASNRELRVKRRDIAASESRTLPSPTADDHYSGTKRISRGKSQRTDLKESRPKPPAGGETVGGRGLFVGRLHSQSHRT